MTADGSIPAHIGAAADALAKLSVTEPELSERLAKLIAVVADEATRTPRFAKSIIGAVHSDGATAAKPRRTGRRSPGIFDPLAVYLSAGESGLRKRLGELDLEQLRDIVAEHGMDHDKLAMKWKDPERVIERIVEKVIARSAKGSAFRSN